MVNLERMEKKGLLVHQGHLGLQVCLVNAAMMEAQELMVYLVEMVPLVQGVSVENLVLLGHPVQLDILEIQDIMVNKESLEKEAAPVPQVHKDLLVLLVFLDVLALKVFLVQKEKMVSLA